MKKTTLLRISFALSLPLLASLAYAKEGNLSRIAFGSCAKENLEMPIWNAVLESEPDVWIWLGDNVYGDTENMAEMAAKYAMQKSKPGYVKLRSTCQIIGTWDDHDYGKNNAGKEYSAKVASQQALLDFLDEPTNSPRRLQEGVYWSHTYGKVGQQVKVILLDARYHRDSPSDPRGDILGKAQWSWLTRELTQNQSEITIIASGIQVIPQDQRYEKWHQFPQARERLFDLIAKSRARGVIFISGDRHIAEFSKLDREEMEYALHEITSSGMNNAWESFKGEPNRHRLGEVFHQNNYGLLEIDWEQRKILATIRDESNAAQRSLEIAF